MGNTPPVGRKRKAPSFPLLVACKRWHISAPAEATGWASLITDIARQIASRLLKHDVVDYIAFRAVCSGWRACTPTARDFTLGIRCLRPVDWVALCDGDAVRPDAACEITFFHRRTARCLRVRLPELQRHRIIGFTDGLLILLHRRTTAVCVLHPFTRVAVSFPSLAPVYYRLVNDRHSMLEMRAVVCTSASSTTSIAIVAWFRFTPVVLSAEAGHSSWKVIHKDINLGNTSPFQGRLYGFVHSARQILQIYPPKPLGPVVAHVPHEFGNPLSCEYYLVDSVGHMLLVVQHPNVVDRALEWWQRFVFVIFKVDVSRWKLIPVSNLDNLALFLCKDRCLSISAKDLPSISSNSLYFSVQLPDPVIVHSLSSRSFERTSMFCRLHDLEERIRPSVRPFTLADHLLTYCNHRQRSNGLMFHEYHCIPQFFEELCKKIRTENSELRISLVRDENHPKRRRVAPKK